MSRQRRLELGNRLVRGRGRGFTTAVSDAQALTARHSEDLVDLAQASDTPWQLRPERHGRPVHPLAAWGAYVQNLIDGEASAESCEGWSAAGDSAGLANGIVMP